MASKNTESSPQGTGDDGSGGSSSDTPPQSPTSDQGGGKVFKSGPLYLSSKGIGWTSWKKRWFILTNTSLVFFRSDPDVAPQKGSELNLTLGGIDLNNSGSVVVKADKKLLTILFPDGGREGRAFTLKADTLEDLYEWKEALENALAEAPNAGIAMDQKESDTKDGSSEQTFVIVAKERQPEKSTVIGRPILHALEEVDGSPSFLEKALKFIEGDGVRVEGILRQAADVEHVERRIREYEQGKTEFSAEEDAHVIADCIKYIIRELPSYPVPASCCTALVEACRKTNGSDRKTRANAMRVVICETFPEPNRRFLQRILIMMQIVASHKNENLMAPPAVAACMAPLLLRPLLIGDCEIENDFDVGSDSSSMLLQAAAGANHAQAIVITLLEEYNKIFGEGSISPELYDSDESGSEGEEATDDDESYDDDGTGESDAYTDDEVEIEDGSYSGSYDSGEENSNGEKDLDDSGSGSKSPEVHDDHKARQKLSSSTLKIKSLRRHGDVQEHETVPDRVNNIPEKKRVDSAKNNNVPIDRSSVNKSNHYNQVPMMHKSTTLNQQSAGWGRAHGKKNHSMESIDFNLEEEDDVQNLEATKADLQNRVSKEVKRNETLQAGLDKRKKSLDEDHLDLVQEVAKLQKQLVKEKNKRIALEAVLKNPLGSIPNLSSLDEKTKAEIQELVRAESDVAKLKHKVDDLGEKLKREQADSSSDNEAPNTQHHERSTKGTSDLPSSSSSKAGKPPVQANLKKPSTKEGGSSTSALTKFTTRLNFLK